jgi:tetratricopeptide (TPR) repeat protein
LRFNVARLAATSEELPRDLDGLVKLAEEASQKETSAWSLHAVALAYYRTGKNGDALRYAMKSLADFPEWSGHINNYQLLALIYHRLNKPEQARRWREKAAEWIGRTGDSLEVRSLNRWPLWPHDLEAMWLFEREIARTLPNPKR